MTNQQYCQTRYDEFPVSLVDNISDLNVIVVRPVRELNQKKAYQVRIDLDDKDSIRGIAHVQKLIKMVRRYGDRIKIIYAQPTRVFLVELPANKYAPFRETPNLEIILVKDLAGKEEDNEIERKSFSELEDGKYYFYVVGRKKGNEVYDGSKRYFGEVLRRLDRIGELRDISVYAQKISGENQNGS